MYVSKVELFKKGRYKIYIDEQYEFVLYSSELRKYGIREGETITQDTYDEIIHVLLVKRARLRAMNLLMKHSFTEKQLRVKLEDGEYPQSVIDNAIEYVCSFGYVDDRLYAKDYVESHRTDKSISRMRYDLINKGISKDIVNEVIREIEDSDEPIDETILIKKLLAKRKYNPEESTYEEKQKAMAYLINKGFSIESVRRVMKYDFD